MTKTYKKRIGKGKMIKNGYIAIKSPNHPFCDFRGFVMEHRLIMEKRIGRYLFPNEKVHHIDGNPRNNDPANLLIMHQRQHSREHKNPAVNWGLLEDPRWLKEQYETIDKTPNQIAKDLGCANQAVRNALDRFNIRPIPKGKPRPPIKYPELHDPVWLKSKLKVLSQQQIADLLGCKSALVCTYRKKHNLELKAKHPIKTKFPQLRNENWLRERCRTMSQADIASSLGCDRSLVSQHMRSFGIKTRFTNQYSKN